MKISLLTMTLSTVQTADWSEAWICDGVMEWCDRLFPDQRIRPVWRDLGGAISLLAQYVCLMDWKYFSLFLGGSGDHSIPMIDVLRTLIEPLYSWLWCQRTGLRSRVYDEEAVRSSHQFTVEPSHYRTRPLRYYRRFVTFRTLHHIR